MHQRIIVCGGRGYADRRTLFDVLDTAHAANPIELLIHGGAKGADALAQAWAEDRHVLCKSYPANWNKYGTKAGPVRNRQMLGESPHLVIAFPGGRGTTDMVKQAEADRVPVVRVKRSLGAK